MKRLRVFSVLNFEKLKEMNYDECDSTIIKHVKEVVTRRSVDGMIGPQIPYYDGDKYDITAAYDIIDSRYNKHGMLTALLTAQRTDEGMQVKLVSCKWKESKKPPPSFKF